VWVLLVIARLNVGGTARYITTLTTGLQESGIDVLIATGNVQGAEAEASGLAELPLVRIPHLGRSVSPVRDLLAWQQLSRIISRYQPTVIHSHTFKAGLLTRLRTVSVPLVHTFHGHLLSDPEFSGIKQRAIVRIERRLAKRAQQLITVGERVGSELRDSGIGVPEQYISIPPGVEPPNHIDRNKALAALGLTDNGCLNITWLARVTGVKRPDRVLRLAERFPDANFIVAGGGDLLDSTRQSAPANVSVLGWTPAEYALSIADIVLNTSDNEGMPVALIEAQLLGLPVVATDVGASAEVIVDERTGFVTALNESAMEASLLKLIRNRQLREDFGRAATVHATQAFSIDTMIKKHMDVYQKVSSAHFRNGRSGQGNL
jgi:glycosyltransferase involved in cell wall biosynthesis